MTVSKQLQSDLSGDDIIRHNQSRDTDPDEKPAPAEKANQSRSSVAEGESLCDLASRKKAAPRDAGHNE